LDQVLILLQRLLEDLQIHLILLVRGAEVIGCLRYARLLEAEVGIQSIVVGFLLLFILGLVNLSKVKSQLFIAAQDRICVPCSLSVAVLVLSYLSRA